MLRACLLRLAITVLLLIVFLSRDGSLAFGGAGFCYPLSRLSVDITSTVSSFGQYHTNVETKSVSGLKCGSEAILKNSCRTGVVYGRRKTSLTGLASNKDIEGRRSSGPLGEKKNNAYRRRGGGLRVTIPLGRRNRSQNREMRSGGGDTDRDFMNCEEPSSHSPNSIVITETPPRGRWRRLRVLRPRNRNEGRGNTDKQSQEERQLPSASSSQRRGGNNRRAKQGRRDETAAENPHEHAKSSTRSITPSTPLSPPPIAEELMEIVTVENVTGDSVRDSHVDVDPIAETKWGTSQEHSDENEDETEESTKKSSKEQRVSFSATAKSSRVLKLDSGNSALLTKYMTQPVERYSVISFYGDADGDSIEDESGGQVSGRRWLIRRLTKQESAPYRSKERAIGNGNRSRPNFLNRRSPTEDADEGPGLAVDTKSENFFRLAVPLKPLIGLDLTPVIDVEVIPPARKIAPSNINFEENERASDHEADSDQKDSNSNGGWRDRIMGKGIDDNEVVRIQSLRVSLLSTEEEVREIMNKKKSLPFRKQQSVKTKIANPAATAVSKNQNVRKMGYEAIGMVDTVAEWTQPHLTFESEITWNEGGANKRKSHDCSITVKSTVATSLTIPPLPISLPLPTALFVKKLGSTITKRVLALVLPRFLRLLESDFKRWANIDAKDKPAEE
mmetsp:Transcript_3537/g.5334  ORF Transcript_3537/g.5334 Transcript_3537/m.5334 type:complete len:674 (+) Transcript_3537:811-2832(+)